MGMKASFAFALAIAIFAAGLGKSSAAEDGAAPTLHYRHPHYRHPYHRPAKSSAGPAASTIQDAPLAIRPVTPPAVQNDSDGLSRDPEDCNMGCLDNTP
jgi:hypothetical protein